MQRRNFIKTSVSASTGLMLSSLQSSAAGKPSFVQNKNFELKIMATNWGFRGSVDDFCASAKKEGYDGIEMWWPGEKKGQDDLFAALKKHSLAVGFLAGTGESDYRKHVDSFKRMIDAVANNNVQKPLYINCHSGKDYFSYNENKAFIDHTTALSKQTGILICHETHRARMLYSAPAAKQYMQQNPELKLTFDVSHWCNVSESLLQDQPETMTLAVDRAEHIHARIGHPQGPQVSDPRAPEFEGAVKAHMGWWDRIVARKTEKGERLTILTAFGPPDYMPTLPYTRQPLADQWAINVHMMHLLRKRYS